MLRIKSLDVKHPSVNVNVSIIYLRMGPMISNVYVSIRIKNMIYTPENVLAKNAPIVTVLLVRGHVLVVKNLEIM